MEEQDTYDLLIGDVDRHIDKLTSSPPAESEACRIHREGTILLLRCQRVSLVQQKNSTNEARKAGGIIGAIVAAAIAVIQWFLAK